MAGVVSNGRHLRVTAGRTVKIKAGMARYLSGRCCRDRQENGKTNIKRRNSKGKKALENQVKRDTKE